VTLAFGYEFELPEGVTIENEKWTPENLDLIYVLQGTYHNKKEIFELIWCDSAQRPAYMPNERIQDGFNYETDTLWGMLLGSSSVGGNYEGPIYEMVEQQMLEMAAVLEKALIGNNKYQYELEQKIFKQIEDFELEAFAELDEGWIGLQPGMKASFCNKRLVVTDENG